MNLPCAFGSFLYLLREISIEIFIHFNWLAFLLLRYKNASTSDFQVCYQICNIQMFYILCVVFLYFGSALLPMFVFVSGYISIGKVIMTIKHEQSPRFNFQYHINWVRLCTPIIPALGRQRQGIKSLC